MTGRGPLGASLVLLGRALLRIGLRGRDREFLRGDLDEELIGRGRASSIAAAAWYLGQAVRSVLGRWTPYELHMRTIRGRWNRDRRGDGFASTLWHDIRFSVRVLRKQPAFSAGALLTLALGIGAVTTMFTFVNGMMLRPLPYPDADRLVMLEETTPRGSVSRVDYLNYRDWAGRSDSFSATAAHYDTSFNVSTDDEPVRVSGLLATGDLFRVLGVEAMIGRTFTAADDDPSRPRVVVLSHGLWQRSFGADPGIVGQEIRLHGRPYTVIGVMPASFAYPEYEDLWTPARVEPAEMVRGNNYWQVVARLSDEVTLGAARQQMEAIGLQLAAEYPEINSKRGVGITRFRDNWLGESKVAVLVFLGVVVFVQLIATVNVGNLLLARASTRRKEVAIRSAIGASRGRVIRQLLTESLLLASAGGFFGLLLGRVGRNAVLSAIPIEIPRWFDFGIDLRVALFIALLTALTGVVFGLVPALHASRDLNEPLKHGGDGGASSGRQRLRSGLVVAEVALALVLLVGAALMMKGLTRVRSVEPGLDPEGVLTVRLSLPAAQYAEPAQRRSFTEELLRRIRSTPGVGLASAVAWLPFSSSGSSTWVSPEDLELAPDERPPVANFNVVDGSYFDVLDIPVLRGRAFDEDDARAESRPVAVVSEAAAETLWPGADAIGRRFRFGRPDEVENPLFTIVGVVGDVRFWGLGNPVQMGVYIPWQNNPRHSQTLVVSASGDPGAQIDSIRRQVRDLDPNLALYQVRTMDRVVAESLWEPVMYSRMFGIFAGLALALAAVGLYGVISFSVGRRTQEIGIRLALGAGGDDVLRMVVRQAMTLVAIGVGLGLLGAALVSGVLSGLLYGVDARDPLVYGAVALALAVVALVATLVPGRRATRVDPAVALRSD